MNTLRKFPVWFIKQRLSGRIFLAVLGLFILICLIGGLSLMLTRSNQQALSITATSTATDTIVFTTWTPTPTTLLASTSEVDTTGTPKPTRTPFPTGLPTESLDTSTPVVFAATFSPSQNHIVVVITHVDKKLEYVDIQNAGLIEVNLSGWALVSEVGNQVCNLKGLLKPKEVLRIWAAFGPTGQTGIINCGFKNPIWLDEQLDPAVLYNTKGDEVSRYPQP